MIINKFGDLTRKIQCHAINTLVKVIKRAQRDQDIETPKMMLNEVLVFLARPTTKPSHRVYCLGLLNKFATMEASDDASIRTSLLSIYFGLFNKLLH